MGRLAQGYCSDATLRQSFQVRLNELGVRKLDYGKLINTLAPESPHSVDIPGTFGIQVSAASSQVFKEDQL